MIDLTIRYTNWFYTIKQSPESVKQFFAGKKIAEYQMNGQTHDIIYFYERH